MTPRVTVPAALLVLGLSAACVSPPRPAGPVRVEGPIPSAGSRATAGTPSTRVVQGPLLLRGAQLTGDEGGVYRWAVELVNPSDATFDVAVVVTLLDGRDSPVGSTVRDLRIRPGETSALDGSIAMDSSPARFRIEYWVRLPPPPERRIERIGP